MAYETITNPLEALLNLVNPNVQEKVNTDDFIGYDNYRLRICLKWFANVKAYRALQVYHTDNEILAIKQALLQECADRLISIPSEGILMAKEIGFNLPKECY